MVTMTASRTGRQLQRYNNQGSRQVVGCIPYRLRKTNQSHILVEELEVLLISSQKSTKMMFPKGGWELDESMVEAASRECIEEAGIDGIVGCKLGKWNFKSKSQPKYHEGHMFALRVTKELEAWPEQNVRQRVWMSVKEARELCSHGWMIEALDKLVHRLVAPRQRKEEEKRAYCSFEHRIISSLAHSGEEVESCIVS
ncbi:hypothetical protein LguiB_022537 [Lonicera macranthoides]